MNDFDRTFAFIMRWEGGATFTNNPRDPGGATKWGVTQNTYSAWRRSKGLPQASVAVCTQGEAQAIFTRDYWAPVTPGRPWPLNLVMADTAYNCGVRRAAAWIEAAKTRVPASDPQRMTKLARDVLAQRLRHYRALRNDPDADLGWAYKGWLNRVADLKRVAGL